MLLKKNHPAHKENEIVSHRSNSNRSNGRDEEPGGIKVTEDQDGCIVF